jgi:Adenomatosis polyposis coli down-regulated 1
MFIAKVLALLISVMVSALVAQPKATPEAGLSAARVRSGVEVMGLWESEHCVVQERSGVRTSSKSLFVFLDRDWALEFMQYADDQCARPTMKAFFTGRYEITQPSSVVAAANDATFGFSYKAVTLYDEALLADANRGICGQRVWERGKPQDVSATGCLWVTPVSACSEEFDLVKVEGNRLFLGERPQPGQDLCSEDRRAQKLRSLPLLRR